MLNLKHTLLLTLLLLTSVMSKAETTKTATLLSYSTISGMSTGDTKTVLIGNPHANNGYFMGHTGSAATSSGAGFSTEDVMLSAAKELANSTNSSSYLWTLTKTGENTITIKVNDYNPYGTTDNEAVDWSTNTVTWTLGYATSVALTSNSDMTSGYNTDYLIRLSPSTISSTTYLNAQGAIGSMKFYTGTGEWSVWQIYEVTETESSSTDTETTANKNSDDGSSVSKSGYTLVFSTETSAASSYFPSSTGVTVASDAFTSSFSDQTTLESYWTYCPKGNSVWCSRMGTDESEQRQMQSYTDGTLNLKAGQVTSAYDNTSKFLTSGVYTSKNYKYGIIEVKAKCNAHTSNFPAIWIMPADHASDDVYDVPWPACGECDIMEQIGTSTNAYGTVHTGIRYNTFGKSYTTSSNKSVTDATYHIYTLLWDESSLTWFIDGTQLWKYSKDTNLSEELQYQQFPYNKPYRIILNQAVGKNSSWGSEDPDASYTYEMDVAYVRVFQKTAGYTDPTCSFQTVEVGKTYQIKASTGQVLAAASTSSGATVSGATASSTDALQQWLVKGSAASGYYFHLNNTSYCMQNSTSSVTTAAEEWVTNQCNDGAQEAQTFYYTSDNKLYTLLNNNSSTKYYLVLSSTGTLSTTTSATSATTFSFEEPSSTPTTTYTITCNTADNGSVTASPTSAESGATVTLTVTPNTGYELSTLSVKDASDNEVTVSNNTFEMPASNVTVTATFTESTTPSTEVTLPTDRPYAMQVSGTDLYLDMESTTTETDGGACVTLQSNIYPVKFAASTTTSGSWTIQSYNSSKYLAAAYKSTDATTLGWSTIAQDDSYDWTVATVSDDANAYTFARSDGNQIYYNTAAVGSCLYCNGTNSGDDTSVVGTVANFVLVPMYTTTISENITGGTVAYAYTTSYSVAAAGQTVTLTATPSTGYTFTSYTVTYVDANGATQPVTVNSNGTFTMPSGDVTVNATFTKSATTTYTVTVNTVAGGTVTASATSATAGTTITLSNTPSTDYTFSSYIVTDASGNAVTVNSDGTFTMPASNVTVTGTFTTTKMTFALKTSGSIDTTKKYLIVYQSSASATSGTMMSSAFTDATVTGSSNTSGAEVGSNVTITSNQIVTDESNAFTFESTGSNYYIKNNAGYYFGSYGTSGGGGGGSSNGTKYFAVSQTSGDDYKNTISLSSGQVSITGAYQGKSTYYLQYCSGTTSYFQYTSSSYTKPYLYEQVDVSYTLSITQPANGTVTATVNGTSTTTTATVAAGTTVTLTSEAQTGYTLDDYTVTEESGSAVTVNDDGTFTMPSSTVTITATFLPLYNVTCSTVTGGTVSATPTSAIAGEAVTLSHTTATGYEFGSYTVTYTDDETITVKVNDNNTFTMPAANVTVSATFNKLYDITCNTATNGTVTASATSALEGATVTITATPDDGYVLQTLSVADTDETAVETKETTDGKYTFTMPASAVTITAVFSEPTLALTDAAPTLVAGTYKAGNVTYTRSGTAGNYGTYCMPFDVKISDITCFDHIYIPHELALYNTTSDRLRIFFNEVADIEGYGDIIPAGQPFIAHLTGAVTLTNATVVTYTANQTPEIINSTINIYNWNESTSVGGLIPRNKNMDLTFSGSFTKTTYSNYDSSNLTIEYFVSDGGFKNLTSNGSISPFRAIMLLYTLSSTEVKSIDIVFNSGDDATSIDSIFKQGENSNSVYSIDGRKLKTDTSPGHELDNLPPGLYIVNGQKVLKK